MTILRDFMNAEPVQMFFVGMACGAGFIALAVDLIVR